MAAEWRCRRCNGVPCPAPCGRPDRQGWLCLQRNYTFPPRRDARAGICFSSALTVSGPATSLAWSRNPLANGMALSRGMPAFWRAPIASAAPPPRHHPHSRPDRGVGARHHRRTRHRPGTPRPERRLRRTLPRRAVRAGVRACGPFLLSKPQCVLCNPGFPPSKFLILPRHANPIPPSPPPPSARP